MHNTSQSRRRGNGASPEILSTSINPVLRAVLRRDRCGEKSIARRIARLGALSLVCAASLLGGRAMAQTQPTSVTTWTGLGPNNFTNDGANWNTGVVPTGAAEIHFAGTTQLNVNNNLRNATPDGLFTDANAGAFVFTGNTIFLSGGLTNNSSNLETLNLPIQLVSSQTWTAASANITFGSTVNLAGSALTLVGSNNFEFDGVISDSSNGAGSLIQNSKGLTLLTAVNTYTGPTTVMRGILGVNGTIASAQTTVAAGAYLIGTGTINGNLVNNGTFVPVTANPAQAALFAQLVTLPSVSVPSSALQGASFTFHVNGNYSQGSTGVLVIPYGGPLPSQHNTLVVGGQADLGGALRLVQVNGGRLQPGQVVPIVQASGGVEGTFANVQNAGLLGAQVVYQPNQVVLEAAQGQVTQTLKTIPGIPQNYLAVGKALDSAAGDPRAAAIFQALSADTMKQYVKDIGHISPDQVSATNSVGTSVSNLHTANMQLRMDALRSGLSGFSPLGFHISDSSSDFSSGYAGPAGPADKDSKEYQPAPVDLRWGSFITGSGEFDKVGDTSAAHGFNLDSGGITLGVDFKFSPHFVAGLMLGWTDTGVDIADGGKIRVDSGKVGLYSTYFNGGFYLDTAVQGGYSSYETHRTGMGGDALSSPHGGDVNVLVEPGYDWKIGALSIGPTASFQYSYQGTNAFTEHGSTAPLSVGGIDTNSFISTVGMKASYDCKCGSTIIRPEVRLSWQHEYGDVTTPIDGRLASGAGDSFTVYGPTIGRDSMLVGAGFSIIWSERVSSYVYYDGEFFRTNYSSSAVTGGFRVLF